VSKKRTVYRNYSPAGPVIASFHTSDAPIRFVMGPLGSSKSTAMIFEILRRATEQEPGPDGLRHTRFGVIRATYNEIENATIPSWRTWVGDEFGQFMWSQPPKHILKFGDVRSEVLFLALDEPDGPDKLKGMEFTGVWINEITTVPRTVVAMAHRRTNRFPSMVDGGATWAGTIGDTNPCDENHWFYKLVHGEDGMAADRLDGLEFFKQPPAVIEKDGRWHTNPNAENLQNLAEGYYNTQIALSTEDEIRVYLGGEWGFVQSGKPVTPEYSDYMHCQDFELDPEVPLHLGADWGRTPACVFMQKARNGQIRVLDELVVGTGGMGAIRFAEVLGAKLAADYPGIVISSMTGDPAGNHRSQTDDRTVFEIMKTNGLPFKPASTNDPTLRREALTLPMTRIIDGEPAFLVHPRCKVLRKGLSGGYVYRRLKVSGEERYEERPSKNHYSHICEALQYGLLGVGEGRVVLKRDIPKYTHQPTADSDYSVFGHR